MFISLADFDIRWGVKSRESGGKKKKRNKSGGGGEGVFKRFRSHII